MPASSTWPSAASPPARPPQPAALATAPGCLVLGQFAEEAAGDDDRYPGACDDEVVGVIAAWDRIEAYASSRKRAAFRSGILNQRKAMIIASATALLDPAEARAAEAKVLDRAGALTPPGLRAAITRAVMEVAPGKARQRREHEASKTRVERWAEPSGNAGLAGRELPPAEVLAADQRVTAWARELGKAGLGGGMDALRARAFLDILLGMDSRPLGSSSDRAREPPAPAPSGPLAGVIPPGFAGQVTLTIPAITLLDRAGRPGELAGIGPIDPNPEANTSNRYRTGALADPVPGTSTCRIRRYGWAMSMWRLIAAAMAVRSPSSELTMRSPRRRAPSTTLASTMSVVRVRPARVPVALARPSSRTSTSHPASSRASCAWRGVPRQHWATTGAGTVGTTRRSSKARWRAHIGRSPRSAAISAPESYVTPVTPTAGWRLAG